MAESPAAIAKGLIELSVECPKHNHPFQQFRLVFSKTSEAQAPISKVPVPGSTCSKCVCEVRAPISEVHVEQRFRTYVQSTVAHFECHVRNVIESMFEVPAPILKVMIEQCEMSEAQSSFSKVLFDVFSKRSPTHQQFRRVFPNTSEPQAPISKVPVPGSTCLKCV